MVAESNNTKGNPMSKLEYRAYGTKVFVDVPQLGVSKGGIQMPEDVEPSPIACGVIVSSGPGVMTPNGCWDAPSTKVGDKILFFRGRAVRIPEAGETIHCLSMCDILAVLRGEDIPIPAAIHGWREADLGYEEEQESLRA